MKLISMTDYVLGECIFWSGNEYKYEEIGKSVEKYANFLKQPLTLGMFVPCDEQGNVLGEPAYDPANEQYWAGMQFEYQKAKDRVLFDGFIFTESQKYSYINKVPLSVSYYGLNDGNLQITKIKGNGNFHTWLKLDTIEDLTQCNLTLTQTAINQIQGV